MHAGPLSKNTSIPLTKECLNCIICQAGRLAKAYSSAPCLCLRLNRAAASENVTQSCGLFLPNESTCIYGSSVFIPLSPPQVEVRDLSCCGEKCPGTLQQLRGFSDWNEKNKKGICSSQESLPEQLSVKGQTQATGLVMSRCKNRFWQLSWAANKMGLIKCLRESSGEF